ncbi:MAG: hypothetical protein KA385_13515 [Vicinamibacteria bacterium]|nr:hypothetical protein [Vicinamibacteria bacterium]
MGEIVQNMVRFGRAENRRRVEGLRFDEDGRFLEGPFLGLTIPEAEALEVEYDARASEKVRGSDGKVKPNSKAAEDAAKEWMFYRLCEGKTLSQLFRMWAFANTKDYGVILLTPTFAQQEILDQIAKAGWDDVPLYLIDLKARQLGASTGIQIIWYLLAATLDHEKFLTIADNDENATVLFSIQQTMHELMPFRPVVKFAPSKGNSKWVKTGSTSFISSAEERNPGRGRSYKFIHASEHAFWEDPERVEAGVSSTLPNRRFFVWIKESTANGVANLFYENWIAAEQGTSELIPMFHPWWKHEEYELEDGEFDARKFRRSELPEPMQRIVDYNGSIRVGQLAWYYRECMTEKSGDWDVMAQEYPTWPGQAFRTSGNPVFDVDCYERLLRATKGLAPEFQGDIILESPSASHLGGQPGFNHRLPVFPRGFGP